MRTIPQPTTIIGGWRKLYPLVMGSLTHRQRDRATRFIPLPAPRGRRSNRAFYAHPRALGQWVNSMDRLPTGSAVDANAACRGGKHKRNGTKRAWCPESLVAFETLRRSIRTKTLTGQAVHTSSNEKAERKGWKTQTEPANEERCET